MKGEKLFFDLTFQKDELTHERITDLIGKLQVFVPETMRISRGNPEPYSAQGLGALVKRMLQRSGFTSLEIEGDGCRFRISKNHKYAGWHLRLPYELANHHLAEIAQLVDTFMVQHQGVVAYACEANDNFYQNCSDYGMWEDSGLNMDSLVIEKDEAFKNRYRVNLESLPGHSHVVSGELWFGSCWTMWFGPEYYRYIPQAELLSCEEVLANRKITDDVICVQLYEDVWEPERPEHRKIQRQFREQVGMDVVGHAWEKQGLEQVPKNPAIEILHVESSEGAVVAVHTYLDANGAVVPRSLAVACRIREMDAKGHVIKEWIDDVAKP